MEPLPVTALPHYRAIVALDIERSRASATLAGSTCLGQPTQQVTQMAGYRHPT